MCATQRSRFSPSDPPATSPGEPGKPDRACRRSGRRKLGRRRGSAGRAPFYWPLVRAIVI